MAENLRKIERKESRQLMLIEYSNSGRLAEVPTVLFLSYSLILIKPPNTFITIANNNAIKVMVRPHDLNDLSKLYAECMSDRFFGI